MSKPRGKPASRSVTKARAAQPDAKRTFREKIKPSETELRIGTSGWHYMGWRGPFYPPDAAPKDFLAFYLQHFNTTEINNSFYRVPSEKAVKAWRDSVPDDFCFAWKASRYITHLKRLKEVDESIAFIFQRMSGLGSTFGPVLFQLPPSFKADEKNTARLVSCLKRLPKDRRCTFEFRHPGWYEEATFDLLRDHNVALCISDHEDAPAPWVVTADFVYLRGHGTAGGYAGRYGDAALKNWARHIRRWRQEKRAVFAYFDNDVKSAAPHDATKLIALLQKRG